MTTPRDRRKKSFRIALTLWMATLVLVVALVAIPIQTNAGRWIVVLGAGALWIGGLTLFWRSVALRISSLAPLLFLGFLAFLPTVRPDLGALRQAYLRHLHSYMGTPYVWGGESRLGADCSGMLRRAMIDALVSEGVRRRDLSEIRTAAALWWYDSSADALGKEYQGRTVRQFEAKELNTADYSRLQPGDLAVVMDGKHILGYLGDKQWIDADPNAGKTVIETVPSTTLWFSMPAKIVRWRRLIDDSVATLSPPR